MLGITFFHSGAMPFVYPIASVFFILSFWVDHCLLLRCYKRPVQYDKYLAKNMLRYFKYILFLHILGFILMFGITPIFETEPTLLFIYYPLFLLCFLGACNKATKVSSGPVERRCSIWCCLTCCCRLCCTEKK